MSATETKQKPNEPGITTRLPRYQINPSYTIRVICCVIFIFLTEICLAHYIYRLIKSEINEDFVLKKSFRQEFLNEIRNGIGREEIQRILRELEFFERGTTTRNSSSNNRRKRDALLVDDDNLLNLSPNDGPNVEFFNPKLRSELEAKDELERQKTGKKGAAPGGDSWVWLTSYSRIPMLAIQGFCSATKEYCPPGPTGPQGPRGNPGSKGDRGDTGLPGIPGPIGPRGHPGSIGDKGNQGRTGLDGRDGVPGEPGFDGMPGRNGQDGRPGLPGRDGFNGTNGRTGDRGPIGPPGEKGVAGMYGPRGKTGRPGRHGIPGIPGISAWKTTVNGSDLLIPPSIAGNTYGSSREPIIVYEGENILLRCGANGRPMPLVEWRRTDGQPIYVTANLQAISIPGQVLNLTHINRVHMGSYQCIADNGVPPQANHTFTLEVHFPPLIKIRNQMVGAYIGGNAMLECEVEAFPESVRYWERSDGRLLENGTKYRISNNEHRNGYKAKMVLNITKIEDGQDFTMYHCIAKNERGITKGAFTVYEIDPNLATPPPIADGNIVAVFGVQPPEIVSLEQVCPPPVQCQECPVTEKYINKCTEFSFFFDLLLRWEIRQYGDAVYPGYPNRTQSCELYAVGKPVFHGHIDETYGSWMRDANQVEDQDEEKYWTTSEFNDTILLEYKNKTVFRQNKPTKTYVLATPFQGNTHVIYGGSFYYHARARPIIIRYFLNNDSSLEITIPKGVVNSTNYLYNSERNYLDFNVDENGLWVVFPVPDSKNTAVMKLNATNNQIQYIWNISLPHHKVGETFIVCGVLYAVDNATERNSKIRFALDLYRNKLLDTNLPFTNPFRKTTMLGYNHKYTELYSWDKGNQLTYPVRCNALNYASNDLDNT